MAVVFVPPTLVASIYGMNFHHGMIELDLGLRLPVRAGVDCAGAGGAAAGLQVEEVAMR
jgi:hypothetical protein